MSDSNFLHAARVIGTRTPLAGNDNAFVGRERQIANMHSAVFGTQVTPLWICGPRRIGKSSLSYRIGNDNILSIVRASCDQFVWKGMDEMAELLREQVTQKFKMGTEGEGKLFFKELASVSKHDLRIILVLDEFDGVAVNLEQSEQAFLRATLQDNPYFGIVFISRARPEQLLQDYSQESSRLLGICEVIQVPMLDISDIHRLFEFVQGLCCIEIPAWFLLWIYDRVAGYPICVQRLLKEYLILAHNVGSLPSEEDLMDQEYLFFEATKDDLLGLWNDLSYRMKRTLTDEADEPTSAMLREIKAFNLFKNNLPFRPRWLLEAASECDEL